MPSIATARALDGAMGTALADRGLDPRAPPERWLVERPGEVGAVHAAHRAAGAEILLTCTFNLASRRVGDERVEVLADRALSLARSASAGALVAGAVGPTGLTGLGPGAAAPASALEELYAPALGALASAGADLLWIESQLTADEARVALGCGLRTGLPVAVTVVLSGAPDGAPAEPRPALLADGTPMDDLLCELAASGAAAVGVNCALPGSVPLEEVVARVAASVRVPVVAKPSAGLPGRTISPAAFGRWCASLRRAGASWIGGCCGATAEHVAAAARAVHSG